MKIRSSEQWQQIDSVFSGAFQLPADARASYLSESCKTDPELKAEVERLLAASAKAGDFLEVLDAGQAARLLEGRSDATASIGRYKVIRKIGSGGMGIVYLAEDASLKRRVAVKLLPPWLDASSVANRRLLEEARAASAIDHPNIATVHEIGETDDGRLFITMSYYEGDTLRARMERGPIPVDEALDLSLQCAKGLAAAHRKGIIHRDIKPENLLLTEDGMVKIVDFGIAKVGEQAITQTGTAVGTAAYMSPEQTFAASVDGRTDLWSLGVVLYEMLAGERPFSGANQEATIFSIRSDPLRMNARIMRDASPDVRAIVERCLQKDPGSRYQSAADVANDLESLRGGPRGSNPVMSRKKVLGVAAVTIAAVAGIAAAWQNTRTPGSGEAPLRTGQRALASPASLPAEQGSLAVLPFADMSPASDHEYFSDGIAEELIHVLARVKGLRVVARSSAFQFKGKEIDLREAGARLGVAHVLEGSVRRSGDQLRITVRLADAKQGYEVWSEVFDRKATDVLSIQSEIAGAVARALRIELDPREQPRFARQSDPDAYALYLKGRHLFNQRTDLEQAIRYFRESIARDSTFAPAWAGLGRTWLVMPVYSAVTLPRALDSAEAAIRKALSLDSTLAEAHATLGSMRADDWRWNESEPHFKRALSQNGGDATTHQWYGEMLSRTGRLDEAIAHMKVAQELDPLTSVIPSTLGRTLYSSGRHDEALAMLRMALDFNPRFAVAHEGMGLVLLELGRFDEAIKEFETAVQLAQGLRGTRAHLARGYALAGRTPDAERIFGELKQNARNGNGSPWGVALVAASLGMKDEALSWLELSYQRREISIGYLKITPAFKGLRSDRRYVALLEKIGL